MPAITHGKVLVTGANGFVAAWVVKDLLEHGFSVRGTVRAESKAAYLREHFKVYGDKLEIVIVEDITKEGAFDEAVEGVDAITHIASPVTARIDHPDEVIVPAVNGTQGVLHSALRPGPRAAVKRISVVSSTAAVFDGAPAPDGATRVLDETAWNAVSVPHCRELGGAADAMHKYRASKVLAERAAWATFERESAKAAGGGLGWDLVVYTPPWVFGPIVHEAPTLERFGGSTRSWYNHVVKGEDALSAGQTPVGIDWVDVRDLARAHVLGLTTPAAGGERFIIRAGRGIWQDWINSARKFSDKIPAGDPDYDTSKAYYPSEYVADKSIRLLGIKYRTMDEVTRDTLEDLKARGWL